MKYNRAAILSLVEDHSSSMHKPDHRSGSEQRQSISLIHRSLRQQENRPPAPKKNATAKRRCPGDAVQTLDDDNSLIMLIHM